MSKVLFILACLLIPIIWGIAVNWIFDFWKSSAASSEDNSKNGDRIFPDYQI